MDVVDHNRRAWDRLVRAGHRYTRPEVRLAKTQRAIRRSLDPRGHLAGNDWPVTGGS